MQILIRVVMLKCVLFAAEIILVDCLYFLLLICFTEKRLFPRILFECAMLIFIVKSIGGIRDT